MKQSENIKQLITFLAAEEIELSSTQQEKLSFYHSVLLQYAEKHSVISKTDIQFIVDKHFLSSFYFVKEIKKNLKKKDQILDIGSGAGFPGVILAIYFHNNRVTMVDSVRKKALFLKRVIAEAGLNAVIINARIEDFLKKPAAKPQLITARALASIDKLVDLTRPILKSSILHTIKGENFQSEIIKNREKIIVSPFEIEQNWKDYSAYLMNKVYLKINSV